MFDIYVTTICSFCEDVAKKLPDHEINLLWLATDAYFDSEGKQGVPPHDALIQAVGAELYQKVLAKAEEEDLLFDPDSY